MHKKDSIRSSNEIYNYDLCLDVSCAPSLDRFMFYEKCAPSLKIMLFVVVRAVLRVIYILMKMR